MLCLEISTHTLARTHTHTHTQVWDPVQREPRQELQLPVGRILSSRDRRLLCVLKDNRFINIYDADSGNLHGVIDYDYGKVSMSPVCVTH